MLRILTCPRGPFAAMLIAALCLSPPHASADQTIRGGARASLSIELDSDTISAAEPIRGKLIFTLHEVKDKTAGSHKAVVVNGPHVDIRLDTGMAQALHTVQFPVPLGQTLKVGHRYELRFSIRMDEAFRELLDKPKEQYVLFKPGRWKLSAMIASPPRPPWDDKRNPLFPELVQQFNSKAVEVRITPALTGESLGKGPVLRAIEQAGADLKLRAISFYAHSGVLTQEELLGQINQAEGRLKADLSDLWLTLKHPPQQLEFFTKPGPELTFKSIEDGPVFLLLEPQQRVRLVFDLRAVHRFRMLDVSQVVHAGTRVDLTAPRAAGVYEMIDDSTGKHWGWVLAYGDPKQATGGPLRPDTKELSEKVVEAILRQDIDALAGLGVPELKAREVIHDLRLRLGPGDVRYHQSTGTSNKVRTVMRVNLAPKGVAPVFARELILEFVRVGDELKLKRASVVEAEPE